MSCVIMYQPYSAVAVSSASPLSTSGLSSNSGSFLQSFTAGYSPDQFHSSGGGGSSSHLIRRDDGYDRLTGNVLPTPAHQPNLMQQLTTADNNLDNNKFKLEICSDVSSCAPSPSSIYHNNQLAIGTGGPSPPTAATSPLSRPDSAKLQGAHCANNNPYGNNNVLALRSESNSVVQSGSTILGGGLCVESDADDDDGNSMVNRVQYLAANVIINLNYAGDVSDVVDSHFTRALGNNQQIGNTFNGASEKGRPMTSRNLPASFWDSKARQTHHEQQASPSSAHMNSCPTSSHHHHQQSTSAAAASYAADLYSAAVDPLQSAAGISGALHQLAAATTDWSQYPSGQAAAAAVYHQRHYPSTASAVSYPSRLSGGGYWTAAAAVALQGVSGLQHHHHHHHGEFSHHYGSAAAVAAHHYSNMAGLEGGVQETSKDSLYWPSTF